QQQQPTLGGGLFGGSTTQQPAQQGGGLFGNTQQNASQGGGLFGASTQPQQQQQGGLFGSTTQQPQQGGGLFAGSIGQQQQPAQGSFLGSFGASANRPQAGNSLWKPGATMVPREKSIPEQIYTLLEKWSPESPNSVFQHYFYNSVDPKLVPYFGPAPDEDEKKWEEALAKKPSEGSIPIQAKGFAGVGVRMQYAAKATEELQRRMHEINSSLTANMENHDLKTTVRVADARRRHMALSQRCLALATKVQVLRNRGYAMDNAEEVLKQKLAILEKGAYDVVLNGKQEEIWARLSDLRERASLLKEESDKIGKIAKADSDGSIDDDTMKAIKKLLNDYDSQLSHLKKELESIQTDFEGWENDNQEVARRR
ncbi:putative nuclear pore protein NUP57, partial [Rhizodiscina lignyota]